MFRRIIRNSQNIAWYQSFGLIKALYTSPPGSQLRHYALLPHTRLLGASHAPDREAAPAAEAIIIGLDIETTTILIDEWLHICPLCRISGLDIETTTILVDEWLHICPLCRISGLYIETTTILIHEWLHICRLCRIFYFPWHTH